MPKKKNIAEKADKRRRAKIVVGHDADGKPIIKYASGRTKTELDANIAELRKKYITGDTVVQRDLLFGRYAIEWYETYKEPHISESSRRNYLLTLNKYVLPNLGERQIRAIRAADLQAIMNSLSGFGKTMIGNVYGLLSCVFRQAVADGIIDRNPALSLTKPDYESKKRRALTEAETKAVLAVSDTHEHGLLLRLLYYTGARRGEVLGLQWQDIDFANRRICIRRDVDFKTNKIGKVKTAASVRWVPMPDELFSALNKCRGIGEAFILLSPETHSFIGETTYRRWFNGLMKRLYEFDKTIEHKDLPIKTADTLGPSVANADDQKNPVRISILTAHYFRHNYASVLYNAGVDVLAAQRYLGHSDAKTTLQIYSHLSEARAQTNAEAINDAFSKKAKDSP